MENCFPNPEDGRLRVEREWVGFIHKELKDQTGISADQSRI